MRRRLSLSAGLQLSEVCTDLGRGVATGGSGGSADSPPPPPTATGTVFQPACQIDGLPTESSLELLEV